LVKAAQLVLQHFVKAWAVPRRDQPDNILNELALEELLEDVLLLLGVSMPAF
jgi:hypothetical protein